MVSSTPEPSPSAGSGAPSSIVLATPDGVVLLCVSRDGAVEGDLDQAGEAGRVFVRSVRNAVQKMILEHDRPIEAEVIEKVYAKLKAARTTKYDENTVGYASAMRQVVEMHPDRAWRLQH